MAIKTTIDITLNLNTKTDKSKDSISNPDLQEKSTGKGSKTTASSKIDTTKLDQATATLNTAANSLNTSVVNAGTSLNSSAASLESAAKAILEASRSLKTEINKNSQKSGIQGSTGNVKNINTGTTSNKNIISGPLANKPELISSSNSTRQQPTPVAVTPAQVSTERLKATSPFSMGQITTQARQTLQVSANALKSPPIISSYKNINTSLSSKLLAQQDEYLKSVQSSFENRIKMRQNEIMSLQRSRGTYKYAVSSAESEKITQARTQSSALYSPSGRTIEKPINTFFQPEDKSRGIFKQAEQEVKVLKSYKESLQKYNISNALLLNNKTNKDFLNQQTAFFSKPKPAEPTGPVVDNRTFLQKFKDFDQKFTSNIQSQLGGGGGGSGGSGGEPPSIIGSGGPSSKPLSSLSSELATTTKMMLKFTAVGTALGAVFGSFALGAKTIAEVNTQMTELNRVLATNKSTLDQLKTAAISTAVEYGQSVQEVLKGYNIFAQQGLSVSEIQQRSKTVTLGANVSTLGQQDLSETMTAFLKAYPELEKSPIRLIDSFAAVEDANAVVAKDLADAGKKVAVAANNAGVSFDQLNAITTVIQEATRAGGAQIGTAERRIFLNMNTTKTEGVLKEVGINTKDETGKFKSSFDILQQIADIYPTLTDAKRRDIAQTIAETRFTNQFLALMNNFSKVNKIVTQSQNSSGYATEKNAIQMSSLQKQVGSTGAAFQGLALSVSDGVTTPITDALKATTGLLQALTALSNVKIPGLGSLTSVADTITGAGTTEKGSQGTNLGSAGAIVVEGALLASVVKFIASSLSGLGGSILNAGKAVLSFTGLAVPIATLGGGLLATLGALSAALVLGTGLFYGLNRSLETAQDRLTRTGVTGEKSRSGASLAKFTELSGEFSNLQSRKSALDKETLPSKSSLSALESLQKRNIESIRSAIVQIPESSLKNIKDLKIDNLNNVSFKGQSLEELSKSSPEGLKDLIKTLVELEKQAFKTSTSISEATKVAKGQVSFLGKLLGYKPSGAQEVSTILGGNSNTETNRAAREGIRDPLKRFEKITENMGSTFDNFRKSTSAASTRSDFDNFVKQLGQAGQTDLIKQISLIANPDTNNAVIKEINKKQKGDTGFRFLTGNDRISRKSELTNDEIFNLFQNQMQQAEVETRKASLIKMGRVSESTGLITGDKVSTTNNDALKNTILSEAGKGSALIQTLSKTGAVLEQFTVDISESGKLVLKNANPTDVFKGVNFTTGIDAIVEKLKKAGDILIAGSEVFSKEIIDNAKNTVLGGFGAGRSIEVPKALDEGAKSLKDYSDSSAAAFRVGENGVSTFNERLQQFANSLADVQTKTTEGLTPDDRLKQQEISVVASVINSLGRANKAIDSLSSNLESIDIKNKLDEMFTPSAIDSSRAFGGRNLAVSLGKTFKELSAPEQATDRFSTIFGKIEELQNNKAQLKIVATELDSVKLSLNTVLKSTSPEILKNINVDSLSNLISSNQAGVNSSEIASVMSDLQKNILQGGNSKEDQDKIVTKLLSLIPDSSMFQEQVEKLNMELKPLEEAAKSAIALQQLTISAQQAADSFKLQQKTSGFFSNLKEGIGGGLNAVAGNNAPIIFSEDATGRRQQRGLNGVTNLEIQKQLNRVLSSSDVQSGAIKIFDDAGKRLEAISQDEARTRNQVLDIQASRERKNLKEETRNARVNEFTSSLTSQYGAIDQLLNQGGLNTKAVLGLKAIQTSIEQEAKKPARSFLGPRGDLLQSSTSLLTRLPTLLSSVFNKDDLKGILKGAPDELLKTLSNSGSQEAKDLLLERKAENLEPLVTPATKIEQNTTTMLGYFNTLIGFAQGIFGKLGITPESIKSTANDLTSKRNETVKILSDYFNLPNASIDTNYSTKGNTTVSRNSIITNLEDAKPYKSVFKESRSPIIKNLEDAQQYNTGLKESRTGIISGLSSIGTSSLSKSIAEAIIPKDITSQDMSTVAGIGLGAGTIGYQGYKFGEEYLKNLDSLNTTIANKISSEGGMASAIAKTQGKIPYPTFLPNVPEYLKTFSSAEPAITNPLSFVSKAPSSLSFIDEYAKYKRPLEILANPTAVPSTAEVLSAKTNVTTKLPGGLTSVPEAIPSVGGSIFSKGLGFTSKVLKTLGIIDAPVDAYNSASAAMTGTIAPLFNNDMFRGISNSVLGTNIPNPKSESDRFALQIASNQTRTDSLRGQLNSYTPTSYGLDALGLSSARDSGLFSGLLGGQDYVKSLDYSNNEDLMSLKAMYSNENSPKQLASDLSKVISTDNSLSGSDRAGKELKSINDNIQTQTKQTQTGLEVTNVSDISTAVKDGVEKASSYFSDSFKESISDLKSSFSSLIEALNSNKTNSTTGGQLNDIEARIQALLAPAIDAVVEQANVIRVNSEQKLGELNDVINGVENNTKDKIELIRSELDAKITSEINTIDSKTNVVSQELSLVKSSIETTSKDSKIALSLAGLAQQKADQVETQVNSVQARVTQAALNFNGY